MEAVGARDEQSKQLAIAQHYYADLFVEVPACLIVLLTGFLLIDWHVASAALLVKVTCALIAIALNLACAIAVVLRYRVLQQQGFAATEVYSKAISVMSLPFFPLFSAALVYGIGFVFN